MSIKLQHLAIIGGGPAGLATTRVFLANYPEIKSIDIFVNDDNVGGLWYVPERDNMNNTFDHRKGSGRVMYDYLETNLPKKLMQFSGFQFKDEVREFPKRQDVFNYLQDYFHTFIKGQEKVAIHWNAEVTNVSKVNDQWSVTASTKDSTTPIIEQYDYVVSAIGHFKRPFIPADVKGLDQWLNQGSAIHAKDFSNSEFTRGKTVVVVGNGSSGQDFVNQVSSVAKRVYHSITDVSQTSPIYINDPIISTIPKIVATNWNNHSVELENGEVLSDVDILIYATGYLYDLTIFDKEVREDITGNISGIGKTVTNLWSHIFWNKDPTLAFPLIPLGIVPFPLAELQATLIVEVAKGKFDIFKEQDSDFTKSVQIDAGDDVEYYRSLQYYIDKANEHNAKKNPFQPVQWDDQHKELRLKCPELKQQRNIELHKLTLEFRAHSQSYRI